MKKVAVIIDGGFVKKTFQKKSSTHKNPNAEQIISLSKKIVKKEEELFRIYYYDCPPFEKDITQPVSGDIFKNTNLIKKGNQFIHELKKKDNVAYRNGELKFSGWSIKQQAIKSKINSGDIVSDNDFRPIFKQKRVDIKIGLDIAWLSIKRIVDRIILIAGDSDFIPAMKLARIEGIQIVISPLKNNIHQDMYEHSDELRDFDISILMNEENQ